MKYKNLTIIGTSHIAQQSIDEVEKAVEKIDPGIIAVELDKKRLISLSSNQKGSVRLRDIKRFGIKGFLFGMLGAYVEHKLGDIVKVKPGSELMHAVKLARKNKIRLALIDQDIDITLKRFGKALTWKEKGRFIWDILKAAITRKPEVEFDLRTVPDQKIIDEMITQVKKRYPSIYKVLIVERNEIMARNLAILMVKHPDDQILAVMGAGHEEEIVKLIKSRINLISPMS